MGRMKGFRHVSAQLPCPRPPGDGGKRAVPRLFHLFPLRSCPVFQPDNGNITEYPEIS
ncbi:hypothetical protein HMPREF1326_03133 [Akkermansia sp. KLE1605]|nr:hypothetical protein HMPREF1326_03133 [Akkermansia sp. KLE1605]